MWKAIRDLLTSASESLGVEVPEPPDLGALGDTVTGATQAISGQAGQVAGDVAGTVTDSATGLQETAAGVSELASDAATDVQSRPGG